MRLVVINHLTLDGVMQAPGRSDEDTRGGFSHGGWAIAGNDEAMIQAIGERMAKPDGGLLLGRRLFGHDGPVAKPRLLSSTPTTTGVILAIYQPV